jgi:predicted acyl esterase
VSRSRLIAALAAAALLAIPASAGAETVTVNERFAASDGVSLQTTLTGQAPLAPRPVIVEFSPYGRGSQTLDPGPAYNFLLVQIRGTGDSDGRFDALGPRTQADVAELLRWACRQPWSDGRLGLNGFSASAITIYNSLHRRLPCVRGAVMKSGTYELYRDLLWPGGVSNFIPGAGVLALIGTPAVVQGLDRLARDPASGAEILAGLAEAGLNGIMHSTLDRWWRQRGFRGDVNHLPILAIDGFYDVESRGAFEAFRRFRGDGAHLYVIGAHDGAPAGTDGGVGEARAWLDHYVRGIANGVTRHPRVQLWLADGDREDLLDGEFARFDGDDWPIPRTRWATLALDPTASGTARSLNDGSLVLGRPAASATQSYPAAPSLPSSSDPYNTAIVGGLGPNQLAALYPPLTEMGAAEPLGLSYTTAPFASDVLAAGPASLELRFTTTAPQAAIWAVLSDVWPDGSAHPVAAGRLSSDYPKVIRERSLVRGGRTVQPYGDYSNPDPATPGEARRYRVELWPVGNRFEAGHRLRLDLLGSSAASKPGAPALNTVTVGAGSGSRLLFPVLPGSDLGEALR